MANLSVGITGPSTPVSGAFTVTGHVSEGDFENHIGNPKVTVTFPNGNSTSFDVINSDSWSVQTAVPAGLRGADTFVISVTATWTLPKPKGVLITPTQTDSDSRTFAVRAVNPPRLAITSSPALADPPNFLDAHSTSLPMPFTIAGTMAEGDARISAVNYSIDTGQWFTMPSTSGAWATWQQTFSLAPGYHRIRIQAIDRANLHADFEKWIFVHSNPDPVDDHTGSITSWTRLEPQVRTPDMGRANSARLFDPVWLMTRQWQMGEFQGEDTGSPVSARVRATNAPVTRYALGEIPSSPTTATPYDATRTPLETVVERRAMRPANVDDPRMLSFVVDSGLHFLHMLDQAGLTKSYRSAFSAKFALPQFPSPAPYAVDDAAQRFAQVMAGRALDARRLASACRSGGSATVAADATLAIAAADQPRVKSAADSWLTWYDSIVTEPASPADDGWNPSRLEYAVSVAGALSAQPSDEVTLSAAEVDDGRLDWSNFDVNLPAKLGSTGDQAPASLVETTIPSPVSFRGMPAMRFWELEDSKISYGLMSVGPTDLAHLMMIEYAGSYGNDWYVAPLTVPVGSLTRVDSLVVTDTFGVQRLQRPLGAAGVPATNFAMWQQSIMRRSGDAFSLSASLPSVVSNLFFLPPSLGRVEEGAALEDIVVMRDQMANMAWAVERVVENPIEQPSPRAYDAAPAPAESSAVAGAPPRYVLASTVPENWIPLVPVRAEQTSGPDQLWLQRAALLQPDGGGTKLNQARTEALSTAGKLRIYDEEVPREGARITRSRRLARWSDGSFWVWSAFRRQTGNGEGSSGLQFDQLHGAGGGGASLIAPPPPVIGPPVLSPASLTIDGAATPYSAMLNQVGPGLLNVKIRCVLIQGERQRIVLDAFIVCGSGGAGAVPTGMTLLQGAVSIASSGGGATFVPGDAMLVIQLTQGSKVIAVSTATPVTLFSNEPRFTALTADPGLPYIGGPTTPFSAIVTNPGAGRSGVTLQGWINQGDARRAAGGALITCGTNPDGVLPTGTFAVSGVFSASNTLAGTGGLVPGAATLEMQVIDDGIVLATRTVPVNLQPNTAGIALLTPNETTIAIGGTVRYAATLRNPGAQRFPLFLSYAIVQGTTRREVGRPLLSIPGQTFGVLPPGYSHILGTIPVSNTGTDTGTLVPGPAMVEVALDVNGVPLEKKTIPVTLV
jgi:hypothetical protein